MRAAIKRVSAHHFSFTLMLLSCLVLSTSTVAAADRSTFIPYASGVSARMVLDTAHQQIFVAWTDLDRVEVLSTADYHLIYTFRVPSPSDLDISPDGSTLAIATSSAHILFFSTTTFAKTDDVIYRDSAFGVSGFRYAGNGNAIVRAEEGLSTGGGITAYWEHASNSFKFTSNAMQGPGTYLTSGPIARSGDYSRIILGEEISNGPVQIIDGTTGTVLKNLEFGGYIYGVAVNRNATRYAVCAGLTTANPTLTLLDASYNNLYQDQNGCQGITFSADGNTLYRDTGIGSSMYTQAMDVTTFAVRNIANNYWSSQAGYPTNWRAADSSGMVYGALNLFPGWAFVAIDTTQASTPLRVTTDPVHIMRVIDNIGSSQGGDTIRILCTGLKNANNTSVSVTIGGQAATVTSIYVVAESVALENMRILEVKTPTGTPGFADVTVQTSGGNDTATQAFQYADSTKTFPLSGSPGFLLLDSFRNRLYAANHDQVDVIDPATQQVLTPLVPASGKLPNSEFQGLSLSPDGARLYIADAGARLIHVLNLNSPGTGTSIDPGSLLGSPQSVKPNRVYEMASGRLIGSASAEDYVTPNVFVVDPLSGSGSRWQQAVLLWGTSKDGKRLFGKAPLSGKTYLWDDDRSQLLTSPELTSINGPEAVFNADGTIIAVGGSTPGLRSPYQQFIGSDLNSLGYLQDQGYVEPPAGTPGLSFHPTGALLYRAGLNKVAVYDVQNWKTIGTIVFPEKLTESYTPANSHMLAVDDAGRQFFASTQSGITMMVLHDVPLSVGHVQPQFGVKNSGQTVTIRGSGFHSGVSVAFTGEQAVTTFVDENTLTAIVPSSLSAGWQGLTVTNPDGTSYALPDAFEVLGSQPATPVITGFSPTELAIQLYAASPSVTTVVGTGFSVHDTVEIEGSIVPSAFIDSSHIQASVPLSLTDTPGELSVVVRSPYTGGSNTMLLQLVNPVPVLQAVNPTSVVTGASTNHIELFGTGFVNNSQVLWNGQVLNSVLSRSLTEGTHQQSLSAALPLELVATDGTATVSVYNPLPGGGTSGSLTVTIEPAFPVVDLPATLDFGQVVVNSTSRMPIVLQLVNTGTAPYLQTSATVTGPFSLQNFCSQGKIDPGRGCTMSLQFNPTAVGPVSGTLVLVDNAKGSPHNITLTGIGRVPATIHVPAASATIQAAIDAAYDQDTVTVAPGTYRESIDFKGKDITVKSSDGASKTIIDANGASNAVSFSKGETRDAVLNGFTIQNGAGAGVEIRMANPTITSNIITDNRGYGIELYFSGALIRGNTVRNTTTNMSGRNYGCDFSDGAGISVSNTAGKELTIDGNTIENNVGQCAGAGIQLSLASSTTVSNNIIRNNQALGQGGAISVRVDNVTISQNLIYGNQAGAAGGAIYLAIGSSTINDSGPLATLVTSNTIVNNTIIRNPNIIGAYVDGSQIAFDGYTAQTGLFNNIIIAGDAFNALACNPLYSNEDAIAPVVVYNDLLNTKGPVFGGWCTTPSGTGGVNISTDPKFVSISSNDYHLQSGSPAVDAGYNGALGLQAQDLEGNARIQNGSSRAVASVDMGAYELSGAANQRGSSQVLLVAQNDTATYGKPVNLSVSVTASSPIISGTVGLLDNWTRIAQATVDPNGGATFSVSSLPVGKHHLIATFDGNTQFLESASASVKVTVQGWETSTALSFSSNPVTGGEPETLTARVSSAAGTPGGNVLFIISGLASQTVPLDANGIAAYSTSSLAPGTHYVQAMYVGQGGFLTSRSDNIPLQVDISGITLSLSSSTTTADAGQKVTFTATLLSSGLKPTGSVVFYDGTATLGTGTLADGVATLSTTTLNGGTHSITAYYQGDTNHNSASSPAVSVLIRDFSVSAGTSGSLTVARGGSATSIISVAPISGFAGTVNMSCVVPSNMLRASCSVSSVQLSGGSQNATLTVNTTAPHQAMLGHPGVYLATWTGGVFGIMLIGPLCRRNRRMMLAMILVAISVFTIANCSCGGGSVAGGGGSGGGVTDQGTPTGTYAVTITATSGTASHTITQTVVVQ